VRISAHSEVYGELFAHRGDPLPCGPGSAVMEIAGEIIQDLCHVLTVPELESVADFPQEFEEFKKVDGFSIQASPPKPQGDRPMVPVNRSVVPVGPNPGEVRVGFFYISQSGSRRWWAYRSTPVTCFALPVGRAQVWSECLLLTRTHNVTFHQQAGTSTDRRWPLGV